MLFMKDLGSSDLRPNEIASGEIGIDYSSEKNRGWP